MMIRLLILTAFASLCMTHASFAQNFDYGDELRTPPGVDYDADGDSQFSEDTDDYDYDRDEDDEDNDDDDEEDLRTYNNGDRGNLNTASVVGDDESFHFPQAHEFVRPLYVGADQLRHYRGYWQPGGYDQRAGSPFFHSVPGSPQRGPLAGNGPTAPGDSREAYAQAGYGNAGYGNGGYGNTGYGNSGYGNGGNNSYGYDYNGFAGYGNGSAYGTGYNNGYGTNGYGLNGSGMNGYGAGYGGYAGGGAGAGAGGAGGDPYNYHFGPGYYRSGEYGHFRFPYYSYRRPWFHPGFAGYNRDTNLPW